MTIDYTQLIFSGVRRNKPSSKSEFDIYDEWFTYSDSKYDITCCQLNGTSVIVSCGQGVRHMYIFNEMHLGLVC